MKLFIYLYCVVLLPAISFADAGFNIRRPKAPCFAIFTGIDKLQGYTILRSGKNYQNDFGIVNNNDTVPIYYAEGEKRWHGPVKIVVQDNSTQQNIDSFILSAEGYNLSINLTGIENNRLKHTIEKRKAEYPYILYGDEKVDTASAKRNKYILISMSAIGFLLLFFMVFKRKNEPVNKTA